MSNILQDLDRIKGRISDPSFPNNKGLSNEVGIHVFCYAADEIIDISNTGNVILRDDTYRNSYQKRSHFLPKTQTNLRYPVPFTAYPSKYLYFYLILSIWVANLNSVNDILVCVILYNK